MFKTPSPIQNHILSQLKNAKSLRYSELQPGDIPNDLFNYHLQHLVKKGIVIKSHGGYHLSETGIHYVADPYTGGDALTSFFKMNVITIVSRIASGRTEILNQLRASNPSYGKIGVMGGVVLKGEPIEHAATRKLEQETGLQAAFKLVACERRIMYRSGTLFSDVVFPIAYADTYAGELIHETAFGRNIWVPIDEAIANESAEFDSIKTITIVLRAIKDGSVQGLPCLFYEETQKDADF